MWLVDYFKEDPLRILTIIGGSGGIFYLYDRFRNRLRIKIRIVETNKHLINNKPYSITIEAENLGNTPTSIEPAIVLISYIPPVVKKIKTTRFKKSIYVYEIDPSQKRNLPPRSPVKFTAFCDSRDDEKPFLQLGIYFFKPTVGRKKIIYVKKEGEQQISVIKYLFLEVMYLFFHGIYIKHSTC